MTDDSAARPLSLTDLCEIYGEDPVAVFSELQRETALARLVRKAFGVTSNTGQTIGRPREDAEHRRDRYVVWALRRAEGMNFETACATAAEIRAKEGRRGKGGRRITPEAIRSAVRRRPKNIGDLFGETSKPSPDHLELYLSRSKLH